MSFRRRLTASFAVVLLASMATGAAVNAASPPLITVDSPTLSVNEGQTAHMGGTFTETDGDAVTLTASTGAVVVDPDDATRWAWSKAILDGPALTTVTITATDTDGPSHVDFALTSVNIPPVASTTGPHYVPVFSASDRLFHYTASDVAADAALTNVVDCGSGTVKASDASTLRCFFPEGGTTLVGVRSTDKDGATTDGRISVRETSNVGSVADGVIEINGVGDDQLGGALATPDLNHDGKADIAIGGTTTTSGSVSDPGYVMVVFGRATFATIDLGSLDSAAGIRIDGPAGVGFGRSLASADLNGDGIADLLIGAEGAASGKGVVYVVFGSATIANLNVTTMTGTQGATITGAAAGDLMGRSIAGVGDVNGDHHADVAIGSPGLSSGAGGVDILFGGTTFTNVDLASLGSRGAHISGAGAGSGSSVAGGDVNGDTRSDVVIGADGGVGSNATVIYGQTSLASFDASTLTAGQGFRIGGDETLGITAVGAGDMNGDGFADVVILHPGFTWAASIVKGASTNASIPHLATASRSTVLRITESNDPLGEDLAVFDANHDGRADVLIGANADQNNDVGSGSAFLVRGAATLADVDLAILDARWTRVDGDNTDAFAGDAVAGGDVNGDGIGDPIIGAPGATTWAGLTQPGRVGVFFGHLPDTTPPVVTAPKTSVPVALKLSGSSPVVRATWTATDAGAGIDHFDVALQTDGGAWVALAPTALTHSDKALASGHDYRFRVRGVDGVGNVSAFVMGTTFHLTGYQDSTSTVTYTGKWNVGNSTSYAGGTTRFASTAGKTASLTFTGREVVFAAPTGPTRGSANVYINGVFSKTISLFSSTTQASTVIATWTYSTSATRTIKFVIVGTSGHARFDVDRIVVLK
jgi:FG-GAP repeat